VASLETENRPGTESELPDDILRARVATGDQAALGLLYDRYGRLIVSLADRLLGNQDSAEDVAKDVFVALWKNAQTLADDCTSVRTWLVRTTRQRCLNLLRGPSRSSEWGPREENHWARADIADVARTSRRSLGVADPRDALARLSPEERQALDLAYFGGLTHTQIAARMRLPVRTVDSNLRLALRKLG